MRFDSEPIPLISASGAAAIDSDSGVREAVSSSSDAEEPSLPAQLSTLPTNTETSPAQPEGPSPEFLTRVPHEFARRHLVLSEGVDKDGVEQLAVAPSTGSAAMFNIGVRLRRTVRTRIAEAAELATSIDRAYREFAGVRAEGSEGVPLDTAMVVVDGSSDVQHDLDAALDAMERDLLNVAGKAPVVRLVDLVLFEALQRGASDVHIQPVRDKTLVRYRLDGSLHTVRELPGSLASAVVSRIKVMGRLDVAEQRAPQDGRASVSMGTGHGNEHRRIDLRISSLPNTYGERVVIRLLDPSRSPHLLSLSALGMPHEVKVRYLKEIERTHGIVLSTGPTGSGKTTTLYTTLAYVSAVNAGSLARGCELNIMTVEDPVEYDLSGPGARNGRPNGSHGAGESVKLFVSQTQVDPKKNLTFATGLRHILRQDPDVIMVGEIRDEETARIAVQASLTGHLVLSTLHTNDAASAIARLIDLSVEPFLVASSLSAVLAQRLARKVHQSCEGKGCVECWSTGYKGRTGVFELLVMDPNLRELVSNRAAASEIKAAAERAGMVTLKRAGQTLVDAGVTSAQEVGRVIESLDEEVV